MSVYLPFVAKIKQVLRVIKTHASTCFFYIIYLYYIYYLHYRARTRNSKEELKPIKLHHYDEVRGSKGARYVARLSPLPIFLVAIVNEGTVPSMETADGGDDFLIFWDDETLAIAHFEIFNKFQI